MRRHIRRPSAVTSAVLLGVVTAACAAPQASLGPASPTPSVASPSATASAEVLPVPTAGPIRPDLIGGLSTETDVPFTRAVRCRDAECTVPLDILWPTGGEGLTTFVLLPGGPVPFVERRYMAELGAALAETGAVVFVASYRNPTTGNDDADSLVDVRCAVRFARAETAERGGNPDRVVLVGHSLGGEMTMRAVLEPDDDGADCLAAGSSIPDIAVPLAGFVTTVTPAGDGAPPIVLVSGSADPASRAGPGLADELTEAGHDAEYRELEGIDHPTIVDPDRAPIVEVLVEATAAVSP